MSAREELFEAMTGGGWSLAPGEAESANRLIDAFAHELAEQVLALRSTVPDLKARQLFRDGYDAALMVAAATIDPEAVPAGQPGSEETTP